MPIRRASEGDAPGPSLARRSGIRPRAAQPSGARAGEVICVGESFLIIAERPVGGTSNLFAVGAALIDCRLVGDRGRRGRAPMSHLDALAQEAGVPPLSGFVSADPDASAAQGDEEVPPEGPPTSRWFTAAEGLTAVRGMLDYLTTHPESVGEVKRVIGDLRQVEQVLRALGDEGILWHIEDISSW